MYTITKEFEFCASHRLLGVPEGHKCGRLHGHNYRVRLKLSSKTLIHSMVLDYSALDEFKVYLNSNFDHRDLNEILVTKGFINDSTAEELARFFYRQFVAKWPTLTEVSVSETPKTWATYEGD